VFIHATAQEVLELLDMDEPTLDAASGDDLDLDLGSGDEL